MTATRCRTLAQLQQPQKRLPQTGHRNRSKILAPRAAPRATQGTDDDQNDCSCPCCNRFADYQLTRRATCEVHFKDGSDRTSHLRLCQGALCHGRTWVHGASKHHCEKQCRRNEDFHSCCIRLRLRCFHMKGLRNLAMQCCSNWPVERDVSATASTNMVLKPEPERVCCCHR